MATGDESREAVRLSVVSSYMHILRHLHHSIAESWLHLSDYDVT